MHRLGIGGAGRFHGEHRQYLQYMILHDVLNGAYVVVELATRADAKVFGHGDLHAADVLTVPQRFDKGIGTAKIQ